MRGKRPRKRSGGDSASVKPEPETLLAPPVHKSKPGNGAANPKLAQIGLGLMRDPSQSLYSLMVEAGYADSTARCPSANGVSVDLCIAEARKLHPVADPSIILRTSRRVLQKKLDALENDPEQLREARPAEIARISEVVERWIAPLGADTRELAVRSTAARLSWLMEAIDAHRARGGTLDVALPASPPQTIDVLPVETGETETEKVT